MDPYQALITTASYQAVFDRTGAMKSGYDMLATAGPTPRTFQYGVDGMPSHMTLGGAAVSATYDDAGRRVLKSGWSPRSAHSSFAPQIT